MTHGRKLLFSDQRTDSAKPTQIGQPQLGNRSIACPSKINSHVLSLYLCNCHYYQYLKEKKSSKSNSIIGSRKSTITSKELAYLPLPLSQKTFNTNVIPNNFGSIPNHSMVKLVAFTPSQLSNSTVNNLFPPVQRKSKSYLLQLPLPLITSRNPITLYSVHSVSVLHVNSDAL